MKNIYDYTREELAEFFEKKYNALQVFEWLYQKKIKTFDEVTNMNKVIIKDLKDNYKLNNLKIIKKEDSDYTIKYLIELEDKNKVEAVLMFHNYGISLCVSTQVGCNLNCSFCESGKIKKIRDLNTYEIVLQLFLIEEDINRKITHVVIMGIGEPFDNYKNVIRFIKIINDAKGLNIGARHITVSTCGIVDKINEFSNEKFQVNLAVSLHAANDNLRNELMPINKVYNIEVLLKSVKDYIRKTNRRVTFEYIVIANVNDSYDDAIELSNLLRNINCYVNLIEYNETSNIEYKRSKNTLKFYDILKKNNINVTIRRELGSNISGACGQLSIGR